MSVTRVLPIRAAVLRPVALSGLLAAAALSAIPAQAQGVVAPERRNVVSFTATATQEFTQDLLTVTLQANKDGAQAADVQSALKQLLESALAEARKAAQPGAMDVRTGSFSIYPRYNNQGRINGWQGQAQVILEGTDIPRIAQTAGRLNQLNVVHTGYGLSRALREKNEAAVTSQAIAAYRAKAQELAKAFGFNGYTLGEVNVQAGEGGVDRPIPVMAMRAKAMDAAESAPLPVEPGKGAVSVTVSGQVFLTP